MTTRNERENVMLNTTKTAVELRRSMSKMTRAAFERVAAHYNVAYTQFDKRADVIDAIIEIACAPIVANDDSTPANVVPAPVENVVPQLVAANEIAPEHAPAASTDNTAAINEQLDKLRACASPLVKKQIRRRLRSLGHFGGLSNV